MTHTLPPRLPAVRQAHRPKARPTAANIVVVISGVGVGSDGVTYDYLGSITLTPRVPVPVPVPVPIPVPVPVPVPTPGPLVPVWVNGFRNGNRDWATVFTPGQTVFIEGQGFGAPAGTVSVNHALVPALAWTDTEIRIVCPAQPVGAATGRVTLDIMRADKRGWDSSLGFTLVLPPGAKGRVPF